MKTLTFFILLIIIAMLFNSCNPNQGKSENQIESLLQKSTAFDTIVNGRQVELITIQNPGGIAVQLTNYGARIVSVITPDKMGNYADVALGFKDINSYLNDPINSGCIIGPYANRIAKGKFSIDGVIYQLELNNGPNCLHSGSQAFSKKVWKAEQNENSVTMVYEAPDLEAGFPGNITATAVYTLTADNKLEMKITATSDRKTVINLTNHLYFNLGGEGSGSITEHIIQIISDQIVPVDSNMIPAGVFMPVDNTPFDLRQPVLISAGINKTENIQLSLGRGYDHSWVLNNNGVLSLAAVLTDPVSGRVMELSTNQPGIQLYTGNFMNGKGIGKSGRPYNFREGLALEPQFFADSPNQPNFPSTILEPGKTYEHKTVYSFGLEK